MSEAKNTITIYGASDDLVEVDGPFGDEFGCYNQAMTLSFDDGTRVRAAYSEAGDGCWRVEVVALGEGAEVVEHFKATDSDGKEYSDRVTIRGRFTKIARKSKSALRKVKPPPPPQWEVAMSRVNAEFKRIGFFCVADDVVLSMEEVEDKARAHINWFRDWASDSAQQMERVLAAMMRDAEPREESTTGAKP